MDKKEVSFPKTETSGIKVTVLQPDARNDSSGSNGYDHFGRINMSPISHSLVAHWVQPSPLFPLTKKINSDGLVWRKSKISSGGREMEREKEGDALLIIDRMVVWSYKSRALPPPPLLYPKPQTLTMLGSDQQDYVELCPFHPVAILS